MATFVLVHGSWHGDWCWRLVTPLLRAAGHAVYTPTLTGLGERAHLAHSGVTLETHIEQSTSEHPGSSALLVTEILERDHPYLGYRGPAWPNPLVHQRGVEPARLRAVLRRSPPHLRQQRGIRLRRSQAATLGQSTPIHAT
jgi:hypothetical protein